MHTILTPSLPSKNRKLFFFLKDSEEEKMLSALAWIPKGAAARLPKRLEMTQEEFTAISNDIGAEVMEARMAFEAASLKDSSRSDDAQEDVSDSDDDAEGVVNDDDMKDNDKNDDMKDNDMKMKEDDEKVVEKPGLEKYDLDNYDETESGGKAGIPVFGRTVGLTYHDSNDQDPYIVVNDQLDEDEELQEMEIQPSDSLVIACRTTEEMSHLVYILFLVFYLLGRVRLRGRGKQPVCAPRYPAAHLAPLRGMAGQCGRIKRKLCRNRHV